MVCGKDVNNIDNEVKKAAAIIFARMSSSRLPGKVLLPLTNGKVLLGLIVEQLKLLEDVDILLATSDCSSDDQLSTFAEQCGVPVFRGSLQNVAMRTLDCIRQHKIDYFARINGDSPFLSTELLAKAFAIIRSGDIDMVTNIFPRTFPYGYSLEVLNAASFSSACVHFTVEEQEHITSYFYRNIDSFRYHNIENHIREIGDLRLTVDTPSDYEKLNRVLSLQPLIYMESLEKIAKAFQV